MKQNPNGEYLCERCERGLDGETLVRLVLTDAGVRPLCQPCSAEIRSRAATCEECGAFLGEAALEGVKEGFRPLCGACIHARFSMVAGRPATVNSRTRGA